MFFLTNGIPIIKFIFVVVPLNFRRSGTKNGNFAKNGIKKMLKTIHEPFLKNDFFLKEEPLILP
jgi:hypothetical protein